MQSITMNLTFESPARAQAFFAMMATFFNDATDAVAKLAMPQAQAQAQPETAATPAPAPAPAPEKPAKAPRKPRETVPSVAEAPAAPTPAPAPTPTAAAAPDASASVTVDQVRAAASACVSAGLRDGIATVLGRYNAGAVSQIKPEFLGAALGDFQGLLVAASVAG